MSVMNSRRLTAFSLIENQTLSRRRRSRRSASQQIWLPMAEMGRFRPRQRVCCAATSASPRKLTSGPREKLVAMGQNATSLPSQLRKMYGAGLLILNLVVSRDRRNTLSWKTRWSGCDGAGICSRFDAVAKAELWERWRRGESLKAIGRAFGKPSSSIYFQVAPHGGIRPAPRRRSRLALTLSEREEILRGIAGPDRCAR